VLKEKDKPETKSKKSKIYQKNQMRSKAEKKLAVKILDNESKRDVALSSDSLIKRDNLIDSYTKYVYETLKKNVY